MERSGKKALLIAEKPSVAQDIEKVYKKTGFDMEIDFAAAAGHLLELKTPEEYDARYKTWRDSDLPILPAKMLYNVSKETANVFTRLKEKLLDPKYDYIINACDAGREGELIFSTIYDHAGCKTPVLRFWAQDNSDPGISKALDGLFPGEDKKDLMQAAYLRQWQDWLEGMNYSRAVSVRAGESYAIGRVMTAVTSMVVTRCRQHDNFKPETFYTCEMQIASPDGEAFTGKMFVEDRNGNQIDTFASEEEIRELLSNGTINGVVEKITSDERKEYAPGLYNLTKLQMDASKILGFDPTKTLNLAQSLYQKKLLSYPRSEATHLSQGLAGEITGHIRAVMAIPAFSDAAEAVINDRKRIDAVMQYKRYVDDSKLTDHYALIPTGVTPDPAQLTPDEQQIYSLVARRFISIFLPPHVYRKQKVICKFADIKTKSEGKAIVDQGWRTLFKEVEDSLLPEMREGDEVTTVGVDIKKGQTKPPAYYTYATLLDAMLNAGNQTDDKEYKEIFKKTKGIGTVATRDGILKKLLKPKGYLRMEKKSIIAQDKAYALVDMLKGHDIINPVLTAQREMELLDVEEGRTDANTYYVHMRQTVTDETKRLLDTIPQATRHSQNQEVLERAQCPLCGGKILITEKSYKCEKYRWKDRKETDCNFIVWKNCNGVFITDELMIQLLCGDTVSVYRKAKNGKSYKTTIQLRDGKVVFPEFEAWRKEHASG